MFNITLYYDNMNIQTFKTFKTLSENNQTYVMQQYCKIKSQYEDFIVFFQLGNFFETYFEDAVTVSNEIGIALTKRTFQNAGDIPLAGVPKQNLETALQKLINKGYRVAIVEQTEDISPEGKKARKLTKIYTTGTLISPKFLNSAQNNYIVSIFKNENTYEFSYADISVGQIYETTASKDEILNEIARLEPAEIIIPEGFDIDLISLGYLVQTLSFDFFENKAHKGIINYTKYVLKEAMIEFEPLKQYSIKDFLSIDFRTRKNLELTGNAYNNKEYGSLLWAIDNCKTPMGKRLLSTYITTPLNNLEEIKKRQNALKSYIEASDTADKINLMLENLPDISRLSTRISNGTITPFELFSIKLGLKNVIEISKIASIDMDEPIKFDLLNDFYEILDRTIIDDIDEINNNNFLKNDADADFDALVDAHKNELSNLLKYETNLINRTKILKLKIKKKNNEYFIELPNSIVSPVPSDFKLVQKMKTGTRYITDELLQLENKILSLESKIEEIKNSILLNLKRYSKEMTPHLRHYSKLISTLDILNSFYMLNKTGDFTFSDFCENEFNFKSLRHLTAEKLNGFEPVDVDFSNKELMFLTGANGIGKSMLLKTSAIGIILSQAGVLIPAQGALHPIFKNLFSILSISDELLNKKSTHEAQMGALSYICKNLTEKSIVLIDEFGKNTSYKEGISLTSGLIKYFIEKQDIKLILSTHFSEVKDYLKPYNDKILYKMIDFENNKRIVKNGIIDKSLGIETAKREEIPHEITSFANEILAVIQ